MGPNLTSDKLGWPFPPHGELNRDVMGTHLTYDKLGFPFPPGGQILDGHKIL